MYFSYYRTITLKYKPSLNGLKKLIICGFSILASFPLHLQRHVGVDCACICVKTDSTFHFIFKEVKTCCQEQKMVQVLCMHLLQIHYRKSLLSTSFCFSSLMTNMCDIHMPVLKLSF